MRQAAWVVLTAVLGLTGSAWAQTPEPTALADPFVGSSGGGNTVPGAGLPFGFVNLSPDTTHGDTNGYDNWSPIVGFSSVHVSGTGGNSKYGNFRVTPTTGPVNPRNLAYDRHDEIAAPGSYTVRIGNRPADEIGVELTATRLVGVQRIRFPQNQTGNLLIDVTSAVQLGGSGPRATAAHAETHPDGSISGWASFEGGWNPAPYTLYFYAVFDHKPSETGLWTAAQGRSEILPGKTVLDGGDQRTQVSNRLGAYARFTDQTVQMKLAVSFISMDKARQNLSGIGDFDAVRADAQAEWRAALGQIEVTGGNDDQRRMFYSALYRSHTMPHDVSGENVWWQGTEPHYEDFYAIWDTFRTLHPLLTLIQPQRQRDIVRSLLDTYTHTGWLPDARIAGANGTTQGGSNGDIVIADAIMKNLGGFDTRLGYEAIRKDAEVESPDPMNVGRVLKDYVALGYMPLSETRSGSRTMDYAYNDFVAGEVALKLGHPDDAQRYATRSLGWRKLWDDHLGCIHPRYADGAWLENYSCDYTYPDSTAPWWDHPYYEGSGYQYSTFVPHDVAGLLEKTGGQTGFTAWLDHIFDTGQYEQGNEPDILAPYLYIHAGRPDRTADRVRKIMAEKYRPTRTGLPGNDDSGAMSSWYVWNAIGLYPNGGQPFYYIGSPVFERSVIHLEKGTFTVVAANVSAANRYVLSAKLNGKPIDRAWLTHKEIMAGGTLELEMGATPGTWATQFTSPPAG
jgi:predicted alpha-1,2-mannosidase